MGRRSRRRRALRVIRTGALIRWVRIVAVIALEWKVLALGLQYLEAAGDEHRVVVPAVEQ